MKGTAARVGSQQHAAGLAFNLVVQGVLDPAQAFVIQADVTDRLRGQIPFGIEALGLALKIDTLQIQFAHARGFCRRDAALDPAEGMRRLEAVAEFVRIHPQDRRKQGSHHLRLRKLARHRVDRIHSQAHGQGIHLPVVDGAALGRHLNGALLLALGARQQDPRTG